MQNFTPSVKGLLPGIDRRKVTESFVVEGKNFLMSLDGPVSGLGRRIVGFETISQPTNVQTFDIEESQESYVCTNEGIFKFNTVSETLDVLYEFAAPVTTEFPWSQAYVGNKAYFARAGYGLLEYDITTAIWTFLTGGSIPPEIYACTEAEGRLILLTATLSAWSAIGDGQDFTPSTGTGAGSQVLTKLGIANPIPLGVQKVPDGYLTFLSSGIMKSQAIQAANPFRHTILSKEHKVLNPYCIILQGAAKIVFASKAGLFETSGAVPKIYEPLMSEYLHERVFPLLDIVNNQNSVRLYAVFDRAWFIISVSSTQQDYVYDIAYLLNLRTREWGSLNASHTAFLNFKVLADNQRGFDYSLLTSDGTISRFDSSVGVEEIPTLSNGYYYHKVPVSLAARVDMTTMTFGCRMDWRTVSTLRMEISSLYDRYAHTAEFRSNNAKIERGEAAGYSGGGRVRNTQFKDFVAGTAGSVIWLDKVNVLIDDTTLVAYGNTFSWNSGAASEQVFAGDCLVEFTTEPSENYPTQFSEIVCVGLSSSNLDETLTNINYGIAAVRAGSTPLVTIFENGSVVLAGAALLTGDDILGVERIGSTIYYKVNGVVVYTSLVHVSVPLLVDCSLNETNDFTFVCRSEMEVGLVLVGTQQQLPQFAPLDAQITVGSFRLFDEQTSDRLSFMSLLTINMLKDAVGAEYEDWADTVQFPIDYEEDWAALPDEEIDWGGDPTLITQYIARILSSLDSYTPDSTQDSGLSLVREEGRAKMFSCYTTGLYHQVQIDALELGDNFDLKTLDATLQFSGRL